MKKITPWQEFCDWVAFGAVLASVPVGTLFGLWLYFEKLYPVESATVWGFIPFALAVIIWSNTSVRQAKVDAVVTKMVRR